MFLSVRDFQAQPRTCYLNWVVALGFFLSLLAWILFQGPLCKAKGRLGLKKESWEVFLEFPHSFFTLLTLLKNLWMFLNSCLPNPRYISGLHGVVVTSEFYGSMQRLLGPGSVMRKANENFQNDHMMKIWRVLCQDSGFFKKTSVAKDLQNSDVLPFFSTSQLAFSNHKNSSAASECPSPPGCPMIYLIVITSSAMALMADIHAKGELVKLQNLASFFQPSRCSPNGHKSWL